VRASYVGILTAAVVVCVPVAASASSHGGAPRAVSAAAGDTNLGGVTPQGYPVVLTVRKDKRQISRATIGLRLPCTVGGTVGLPDAYRRLTVSKSGKFAASFGPETVKNDDGTSTEYSGTVSGKLTARGTKASGKWQLKLVDHDAAGAVTDTCDSGSVSWKASR
jgi:hypothetical protein